MEVLKFIRDHWDDIVAIVSVIGGIFGAREYIKRRRATVDQVAKWARAAADIVGALVSAELIPLSESVYTEWRDKLIQLAHAAGYTVPEDTMKRAHAEAAQRFGELAVRDPTDRIAKRAVPPFAKLLQNGTAK